MNARPAVPPEPPLRGTGLAGRARRRLKRTLARRLPGMSAPEPRTEAWLKQNGMLSVGHRTYGGFRVLVFAGDSARVSIGSWCSIASDVEIMPGGNHRIDTVTSYPMRQYLVPDHMERVGQPWSKGDVRIGNDVWIGQGAKILGGVTVGDGAVVAAWSVVSKDVAPYTIVAGAPARPVRTRFSEETIASLLRIRWWDWQEEAVLERIDDLTSTDLDAFTRKYDPASADWLASKK
ncbi:MAG TPA: CatB-related O-acetyltransferase [Solirubrobacteraceae bacterium]|nr:CatB-related O-acetyltransferase [Solirubrobacteraceae bacterium]